MFVSSAGIDLESTLEYPMYRIRFSRRLSRRLVGGCLPARLYPGPQRSYYITDRSMRLMHACGIPFEIVSTIGPEEIDIDILYPPESILHDSPPGSVRDEILALALSRRHRGKEYVPVYRGRSHGNTDGMILDHRGGRRHYRWEWTHKPSRSKLKSLSDIFPQIMDRARNRHTRFVVSLGGGGFRMFAHPTIFKLIEALNIRHHIEELWGSSGGAVMGLAYALGATHESLEHFGFELWHEKFCLHVTPGIGEVLRNAILGALWPDATINRQGFLDMHQAMQASMTSVARMRMPSVPLYAVTYNMTAKHSEVLTPLRMQHDYYQNFIKHCTPINSILASSAIPILHIPRSIRFGSAMHTYIDGSIVEELPLASIYRKWLIDRQYGLTKSRRLFIVAVNLFPPSTTFRPFMQLPSSPFKFIKLLGITSKLIDLARRYRIEEQMRLINDDSHASVVELNLPRIATDNCLNAGIIPNVIDEAHSTFVSQLLAIEKSLA